MEWIDGLKNRPVADGGIYVLLCADPEGNVSVKLGNYTESGWRAGGEKVPAVIYYGCLDDLPVDVMSKAAAIASQMRADAAKAEYLPTEAEIILDDEFDLADAGDLLGAEE